MKASKRILSVFLTVILIVGLCPSTAMAKQGGRPTALGAAPGSQVVAQGVNVSAPRVVADSSMKAGQKATWDCVWFGSYPQEEVTSADSAYASMGLASWGADGEAVVDGVRYRRLTRDDAAFDRWGG